MNRWDSKKIAFISILIAMSISFVIIGARLVAISSIPAFKLSLAGLPIKIIGFLFGPIIGFIIGFITDIISFVFMPAFYYPLYSVALGVSGMLPGLTAIIFNHFWKRFSNTNTIKRLNEKKILVLHNLKLAIIAKDKHKEDALKEKYESICLKIDKINTWTNEKNALNFGLISVLTILIIVLAILITIIAIIPQSAINESFEGIFKLITHKSIFIVVVSLGIGVCILLLIISRFKMKPNNFKTFAPILTFIVLTEFINIPIIAYADYKALKISFVASMISSLATSFVKIWFNTVVITFAIRIVVPLINKKQFNGYE